MEIAVAEGTGLDVMTALALGCNTGFREMAFVKPEQLSASASANAATNR